MRFVGDVCVCRVTQFSTGRVEKKKKRGVTVEHRIMKTYQREFGGGRRSQTQSPLGKILQCLWRSLDRSMDTVPDACMVTILHHATPHRRNEQKKQRIEKNKR